MNGNESHERAIGALEAALTQRGIRTARQILVWCDGRKGFIDLGAFTESGLIAIEVERSTERIARDLTKARQARAVQLWIVVLNRGVKTRVREKLAALNARENEFLSVFTLPESIKQVARLNELNSGSVVEKQYEIK